MGGARLRRAIEALLRGKGIALVALDPLPVGVAVLTWMFSVERGGPLGWLEELYVAPERRGQGIGGKLLAEVVAAARRKRCTAVSLEVVRGHDRAARLYVRQGFEKLARTRYSLRLGEKK